MKDGKLIIEESTLSGILTSLNILKMLSDTMHTHDPLLNARIERVNLMLKSIEPHEVICGKCSLRESNNQPPSTF